jgi:hypothetical protein
VPGSRGPQPRRRPIPRRALTQQAFLPSVGLISRPRAASGADRAAPSYGVVRKPPGLGKKSCSRRSDAPGTSPYAREVLPPGRRRRARRTKRQTTPRKNWHNRVPPALPPLRLRARERPPVAQTGVCGNGDSAATGVVRPLPGAQLWGQPQTATALKKSALPPLASFCRERQDSAMESKFLAFFACQFCLPL